MSAENLYYFKFVSEIIRSGLWATLSSSARALYPVLLSFSDRNFKRVYPGTKTLLELTGFKHKSSLRQARNELERAGLIQCSLGSGRKNTSYQFRFNLSSEQLGGFDHPQGEVFRSPIGAGIDSPEVGINKPLYNQINISIDNKPLNQKINKKEGLKEELLEKDKLEFLSRRFGSEAVRLAKSECKLSGLAQNIENIENILYRQSKKNLHSWIEMKKNLSKNISSASLEMICTAFISYQDGLFIFQDNLPLHLKTVLDRFAKQVFFEPCTNVSEKKTLIKNRLL